MFTVITHSPAQTFSLGQSLGNLLAPGDILCLFGELGTGKSVLARGVAQGLGIKDKVLSPTFTLINEYQGRLHFYHMDLYRLRGPGDMQDLGYEEYFYGEGVTLIEWAERIVELLPEERLDIIINFVPEGEELREVKFIPRGNHYSHLIEELMAVVRIGN